MVWLPCRVVRESMLSAAADNDGGHGDSIVSPW